MSSKFLLGSKITVLCCVVMCCALLWAFGANSAQAQSRSGKIAFAGLDPQAFSSEIWVMNADGSNPTRLTYSEPFINNAAPTFNRDGSKIAFVSNRDGGNLELYVMNANGSGVQRLTNNDVDENDPAFSPDGSKIAFSAQADFGNPQIFVLKAGQPEGAGNQRVKITDNDHVNTNPTFSPNGSKIAYTSIIFDFSDPGAGPNEEIIVANANGTNPRTLAAHPASDSGPAWSPNGSQIAFSSNRGAEFSEIYVVNANGGTPNRVTNRPATDDMEPAWSPDGAQLTFISLFTEESIFIVNASGGTATNVSTPTINDRNPVWSSGAVPPTASINDVSVTEGNRGSVEATFIVTLSSPSDQPLTVGYATANNRAVAPDDYTQTTGTLSFAPGELRKTFSVPVLGDDKFESIETFFVNLRAVSNVGLGDAQGVATILDDDVLTVEEGMIVFQLSEAEVADIWLMRADGSEQFNITNTPDVIEVEPTWSPDGTRILYTRYLDSETFSQAEIYVMNADGSNRINLTRTLNVNETSAGWSPDGSQIVYVSSTFDGSSEIAVMNADGSNQRRITRNNGSNPSLNLDPVWSPRGNKIAFSGNREGRQSIIVMDTNGANEQILTNNEPTDTAFFDRQPKWSPNGSKITFMREDEAQSFQWDVMLVDANGDNLVNLTGNSNNNDMYPSFSPDGTQIVFSSNADEGFDLDLYALAVPEDEPDTEANASRGKAALPAKAGRAKIRVAAAIQLTNRAGAEEQPDWLRRRLVNGIGVTVRDVRVTEGSSGLTNAVLTVRLSRAARQTVTVKYATANLTARAPLDYQSATGTISFAPGETSKNVTVQIKGDTTPEQDERLTLNLSNATGAGFLDNVAAIEILDDDFAPRNVAVSPANVTGFVGSPQRFTASYSDENGATDIAQAYILINTRLSRTQALSALYDRARNKLYLRNDADTAWLGGFAPGSNNQIANSQGTLNCALTTVRVAGRSLAVTWSFTPNERFSGTKNVFISVNDKSGLSDSWDALGKWTIMNFFDWISSFFQSLASPVQLSSANTTRRSVTLNFTGALDATTANDISRYVVEVNGQVVPVQRASRQSPDTVILQLRDGLGGKEQVRVYWKSLRDANGRTLSGQTPAALVP